MGDDCDSLSASLGLRSCLCLVNSCRLAVPAGDRVLDGAVFISHLGMWSWGAERSLGLSEAYSQPESKSGLEPTVWRWTRVQRRSLQRLEGRQKWQAAGSGRGRRGWRPRQDIRDPASCTQAAAESRLWELRTGPLGAGSRAPLPLPAWAFLWGSSCPAGGKAPAADPPWFPWEVPREAQETVSLPVFHLHKRERATSDMSSVSLILRPF